MLKHILQRLMLLLGLLGILVCIAVIVGTWMVSTRISSATVKAFGVVDHSLSQVEQRVVQAEDRVENLKLTTESVKQGIENWAKQETRQRLAAQLDLQERTEQLNAGLDQVDQWLELSEAVVQIVRQALEIHSSSGTSNRTNGLLEDLSAVRADLNQAVEFVEKLRTWSTGIESNLPEERLKQIIALTARVIATFSSIDSRMEQLSVRLTELQTESKSLESTTLWWIRLTAIGITLLACWMLAGQCSMCSLAWKQMRQSNSVLIS